jgi:hypothetical protein
LTRSKRRKQNLGKARRKSHLVANVEKAMTSPRDHPRSEVVVVKTEGKAVVSEGSPVNLHGRKIVRVAIQMSAGVKIVRHVLWKLDHPKTRSRFVVTSHAEKIGKCAQMKCAVKSGACDQMIGKCARMTFGEMIEECGRTMFGETIGACGRRTFGEMIEERGRMMFGETIGACGQMVLVETIGECGQMIEV